ncbi:MAG: hypothetical protein JST51_01265 [Armatimonadetes bacterium]|nr:hypothetical protein [Armatimonadota bacterium]
MKRPKAGDIFAKTIDGVSYLIHLVLMDKPHGPYVRVYKGSEIRPENLIIDKVGLGIIPAVKNGGWKHVGFQDPGPVTLGPMLKFDGGYPDNWYLIDGETLVLLGKEVPPKFRHLEVKGTDSYFGLDERLQSGINKYSYDKWMEYKKLYKK